MVHSYRVTIDSRQRIGGSTAYDARFRLQSTISNPRSVRLVHSTFINSFWNVREGQNWINASSDNGLTYSQQFVMAPGYYTFDDFIVAVNDWAKAFMSITTDVITAVSTGPAIEWQMVPGLVLGDGPLREALGIANDQTNPVLGQKSNVFLATPLNVSFFCPSLCSGSRHISCDGNSTEQPLLCTVPITSGYGINNVFIPPVPYEVECAHHVDTLHFIALDAYTNTLMRDVQHWTMEVLVTCD